MARPLLSRPQRNLSGGLRGLALLGLALLAAGCSRPSTLEEVRAEGVLHVITRNAPSIYYEGRDGPTGFEYELAKQFAENLGVELRVRIAEDNTDILSVLDRNYAHIGLAGLAGKPGFESRFNTVPTGLMTQSVVIYNQEQSRPKVVDDLVNTTLHIVADGNHLQYLTTLKTTMPELNWEEHPNLDAAGILERVESGVMLYAVVASNELAINQVYYPKVKKAFTLNEPESLTWLFPVKQDSTLRDAAASFIEALKVDGSLAQLTERYYGHLDRLDYVGARTFVSHVRNRLPRYELLFQDYASQYDLDWRLLAAMGYQESHWRPNAVSPTGVRGLMMLTRDTAAYIGVSNRRDPEQSIQGGAQYFTMVHSRIPEQIPEPDRSWFALASYNVGYGHVDDARKLTESAGKNPDRWIDVKEFLPLLTQKEWYSKTRYGYARGHEPVIYVQNIRRYYDVLTWMRDPTRASGQLAHQDPFPETEADQSVAPAGLPEHIALPAIFAVTPPSL